MRTQAHHYGGQIPPNSFPSRAQSAADRNEYREQTENREPTIGVSATSSTLAYVAIGIFVIIILVRFL